MRTQSNTNGFKKIEKEAISALSKWSEVVPVSLLNTPPIDLKAIGRYWGVRQIVERRLDIAGVLYRMDSDSSLIFLNEKDVPGRRRFSWAHELGHIVMADGASQHIACRQPGQRNQTLERCCDVIATEILMPGDIFTTVAERFGWSLKGVRSLANTFEVTIQAAARRLNELINEPALISLWRPFKNQPSKGLKYSWSIPSPSGRTLKPQVKWQTGVDAMPPIYQTADTAGVVTGASKVLMRIGGESLYKWVVTEALAVGRGEKRTVLGFHYLSRPATTVPSNQL